MLRRINRLIRGEIALGFYLAALFWTPVVGWINSFTLTEEQKNECYEAAKEAARKTEECKTIWEKTTSDPVAFFTFVLAVSTIGLWGATVALYAAGRNQLQLARDEFLSSHRPRMRLKHVWLTHNTDWRLGRPLEVNLDVVNIGNTEGLISWINFESVLVPDGERLPQRPPYDEVPPGLDTRTSRFRTNTVV
jgi:hypothetical protein